MIPSLQMFGEPVLAAFGIAAFLLSIQLAVFAPLTVVYELWKRRALERYAAKPFCGRVSVIVPAYNEEKTLRACVESLQASNYPDFEVIVVNDGSTDQTEQCIADLVEGGKVRYLRQSNGGKASALNRGAGAATGDILLYTDADSLFLPATIGQMVRWFADPDVDAVCGNDTPLTLGTPLQKVLAVTTHIGTGFVRRALSVLRALPVISGNLGAVRASTFREVGGFQQIWGEDLEFTFRLHRARKRIIFDPDAMVRADCPADLRSLWRQRIRWSRSYLKVAARYADMFLPRTRLPFSFYLPFNYFAQTIVPVIQIISLPVFITLAMSGENTYEWAWSIALFLGLFTFLGVSVYSILLDRDFKTLKHVPWGFLLIVPLSYLYSCVVLSSIWQELFRRDERWAKVERLPVRKSGAGLILVSALLLVSVGAVRLSHKNETPPPLETPLQPSSPIDRALRADDGKRGDIAVATHFDGWQDWHDAITSVLQSPVAPRLHTIGISAGRVEWAHFRWDGHQSQWSGQQRSTSADMLQEASHAFRDHGFRTVAMVDFYSPKLVRGSQGKAAIRFDGQRSADQVCFSELVDGDYGRQIIDMVSYIARSYPIDAIALTEVGYYSFCFDDRCLHSYHDATGKDSWPKKRFGHGVDRDDPSLWEWRSSKMEQFLQKVADAAHSAGKQLIVDVPVSWKDLRRNGADSGLDYARVLRHADQIVVWNYYGVEQKNPEISRTVVKQLRQEFSPTRFFISVGLWRPHGTIDPSTLHKGIEYSLEEGAPNIWITPNELISGAHWAAVKAAIQHRDESASVEN